MQEGSLRSPKKLRVQTPKQKERKRELRRARYERSREPSNVQERRSALYRNIHGQNFQRSAASTLYPFSNNVHPHPSLAGYSHVQGTIPENLDRTNQNTATSGVTTVYVDSLAGATSVSFGNPDNQAIHRGTFVAAPIHTLTPIPEAFVFGSQESICDSSSSRQGALK